MATSPAFARVIKEKQMKVYELEADGRGNWVWFFTADKVVVPGYPVEAKRQFFATHPPIRIIQNTENVKKGQKRKLADCSNLSYGDLCFSQRAKDLIGSHLEGIGQWLELEYEGGAYWLFNTINVIDA